MNHPTAFQKPNKLHLEPSEFIYNKKKQMKNNFTLQLRS